MFYFILFIFDDVSHGVPNHLLDNSHLSRTLSSVRKSASARTRTCTRVTLLSYNHLPPSPELLRGYSTRAYTIPHFTQSATPFFPGYKTCHTPDQRSEVVLPNVNV